MIFKNFITKLTILLSNESNLNNLLPYEYNILTFLKEMIAYQSFLLKMENYLCDSQNVLFVIKKREVDRIECLCKLYHYIRILKIETQLMKFNGKKIYKFNMFEKKYLFRYTFLYKKIIYLQCLNFVPNKIKKVINQNIKLFTKQSSCENFYVFFKILRKSKIFHFLKLNKFSKDKVYCALYEKLKRLLLSNILFVV
ncbi:hypothetical protein CPARA_1gp133 (nucleomorph) [Cryptomonas paramecium]|uniref:Uncharacterized protein n=1 Tax=Cryptomonas paramaecium TaxID=2898 RepID=F2HHJ5_9CRYP|nr:hypothetical protein CPARA_1gp133 [Cryptomonas paramecium]AEA38791.1 hypothetical protein CPARA_1gp133 [Cryptomonas paramecium]